VLFCRSSSTIHGSIVKAKERVLNVIAKAKEERKCKKMKEASEKTNERLSA
jgi:hypothetical protein